MEIKILWIFAILLIILSVCTVSAKQYVAISNGNLMGEEVYNPGFFKKLFTGNSLSFVGLDAETNSVCNANYVSDELSHTPGLDVPLGYACDIGQYVAYISEGGDIPKDMFIFEKLWERETSDDLPNFMSYYVNDLDFTFVYVCYNCIAEEENPNEESCLSADRTTCVYPTDSLCDINFFYKTVCVDHISTNPVSATTTELDIKIDDVEIENNGVLVLDQVYKITGKAYIEGKCDDCIIETGLKYYGTALSLVSEGGACGDSDSVGVKFDAEDEWIEFTLYDKASEKGSFNLEISAYNGCYKDLGDDIRKLDSETVKLTIFDPNLDEVTTSGSDDYNFIINDDDSNDVICYFCMKDNMINAKYDNSCPEGTSSSVIDCGTPPVINCANDPSDPSCNPSTNPNDPVTICDDCEPFEETFKDKYFDFDNNPVTAYGLSAMAFIFIFIAIMIFISAKRK